MKSRGGPEAANKSSTVGVRIHYAGEYLSWYFKRKKAPMDLDDTRRRVLESAEADVVEALRARAPPNGRSNLGKPEGLSREGLEAILFN